MPLAPLAFELRVPLPEHLSVNELARHAIRTGREEARARGWVGAEGPWDRLDVAWTYAKEELVIKTRWRSGESSAR